MYLRQSRFMNKAQKAKITKQICTNRGALILFIIYIKFMESQCLNRFKKIAFVLSF